MFVRVTADAVTVEESDDLKRLSVVSDLDVADVDGELRRSGLGPMDGDADLDIGVLRERAGAGATAPDWESDWAAMIDFAAGVGWVSPDGRTVRAHLTRAG